MKVKEKEVVRDYVLSSALVMSEEERLAHVWDKRLQGMSYASIARELNAAFAPGVLPNGYNAQSVYKDCAAIMARLRDEYKETALEMVDIELQRFDKVLAGVWPAAEAGDLNAVDRVLAISRERRKMMGLDNPERLQIDWRVQVVDLLQKGTITPQDVIAELGEEALISVNQLMLEKKEYIDAN